MAKQQVVDTLDEMLLRAHEEALTELPARQTQETEALAPLLATAERLRRLNAYRLPEARRRQAKAALAAAWVAQNATASQAQERRAWLALPQAWGRVRGVALAALLALILVIPLTVTAIAASGPGDIGYSARVALERVPALLQPQAQPRADTELTIADRRVADLDAHLQRTGRLAPAAIEALLAGDTAAAAAAATLDQIEQEQIAARIAVHAAELARLAGSTADPEVQAALQAAAQQARQMAARLREPTPRPVAPTATPTPTTLPAAGPDQPTRERPTATRTPSPIPTATAEPRATAHSQTVTPTTRPMGTRTPTDAPTPGHRATERAQTATPPGQPDPTGTARPETPAPGPGQETPGPGRRATEQAQTSTPPAQPTGTMPTPNQGADSPTPGRRATELARTATPAAPTPAGQPDHGAGGQPTGTPAAGQRAAALTQTAAPTAHPSATWTPAPEGAP